MKEKKRKEESSQSQILESRLPRAQSTRLPEALKQALKATYLVQPCSFPNFFRQSHPAPSSRRPGPCQFPKSLSIGIACGPCALPAVWVEKNLHASAPSALTYRACVWIRGEKREKEETKEGRQQAGAVGSRGCGRGNLPCSFDGICSPKLKTFFFAFFNNPTCGRLNT